MCGSYSEVAQTRCVQQPLVLLYDVIVGADARAEGAGTGVSSTASAPPLPTLLPPPSATVLLLETATGLLLEMPSTRRTLRARQGERSERCTAATLHRRHRAAKKTAARTEADARSSPSRPMS